VPALMKKVAALPPQKWAPLQPDVFARAKAILGRSDDLVAHDLTRHLRGGQLKAGARQLFSYQDASGVITRDTCFVFKKVFWQDNRIDHRGNMCWATGIQYPAVFGLGGWHIFICRRELDRIYPPAAPVAADDLPDPLRSKPGTKPTGDWPDVVAAWLIMIAVEDKSRLGNIDQLVSDAKDFLLDTIGWEPQDNKDLRSKIRHFLRFVQT
jgi:hypothetical protein